MGPWHILFIVRPYALNNADIFVRTTIISTDSKRNILKILWRHLQKREMESITLWTHLQTSLNMMLLHFTIVTIQKDIVVAWLGSQQRLAGCRANCSLQCSTFLGHLRSRIHWSMKDKLAHSTRTLPQTEQLPYRPNYSQHTFHGNSWKQCIFTRSLVNYQRTPSCHLVYEKVRQCEQL